MPRARRRPSPSRAAVDAVDYATLADLRYQIRRFLRTREEAARAAGIEPQQYLALLQVKGLERRGPATIGALAELIDRLTRAGLVDRRRDEDDRRQVVVVLRPAGEAALRRLALHSVAELKAEGPDLVASLRRLVRKSTGNGARR
jgi:DNA-binding MarR family transcriptional regulator